MQQRYFLEVAYNGQDHSGFQIQKNAATIQGEINQALETLLKYPVTTYGSSRTDAGVHANQNFLHLDIEETDLPGKKYNINAIISPNIALKEILPVTQDAHARFSAMNRTYRYVIYRQKNPFLKDFGYFFPFPLDWKKMQTVADYLQGRKDFSSFSKRNTQVNNFFCEIQDAKWVNEGDTLVFYITANRFLRGMVRGLVATMLKVGRGQLNFEEFKKIASQQEQGLADFSAPARGLFLQKIQYPSNLFPNIFGG